MAFVQGKNPNGENIDGLDGVTAYDDTIIGNAGADTIYAGGGNDLIKGGGGADYIHGGSGRDTASYADSGTGVTVSLASGKGQGGTAQGDTLVSIEDLTGSNYGDTLQGNTGNNTLSGGGGNDTLKGGGGADTLDGGIGDDMMWVDSADDIAKGGEGIDTLVLGTSMTVSLGNGSLYEGSSGGYHGHGYPYYPYNPKVTGIENVTGSSQADTIYGSNGANILLGGGGDDFIWANDGNDTVDGGAGADMISGGRGADQLTGGAGADTFRFYDFDESTMQSGKPQDVILDFQQGLDRINLASMDFPLSDLLVLDNQSINGTNMSLVGVDTNHDGNFDTGEFAVGVVMAPGSVLMSGDLIV
jgi:Ca2+-binding RTX toxin-like protein